MTSARLSPRRALLGGRCRVSLDRGSFCGESSGDDDPEFGGQVSAGTGRTFGMWQSAGRRNLACGFEVMKSMETCLE